VTDVETLIIADVETLKSGSFSLQCDGFVLRAWDMVEHRCNALA